jgi:hypothetical protein
MKKRQSLSTKKRENAVSQSSKMEGLSWRRAKKNTQMIRLLKKYGRAFSV